MREKLVIRCFTDSEYKKYIEEYVDFNPRWVRRSDEITTVIEGYLDDIDFSNFYLYLKSKQNYLVSNLQRFYTPNEIASSELLKMIITSSFEPTGEECGTKYCYPCSICRGNRVVDGQFNIRLNAALKNKDIIRTIAEDEILVSEKLVEIMTKNNITGAEFLPVSNISKGAKGNKWFYLNIISNVIASKSNVIGDAFRTIDDVNDISTPCGHVIKHLVYSELVIDKKSWDNSDIARTTILFGGHKHLIYPFPYIVVSNKLYTILNVNNIKGANFERAILE